MGLGLISTEAIMYLLDNVRTKTNWVGMSDNVTILGMSGTKSKMFLGYDMSAKTKRCWHGCIVREAPLAMGTDVEVVGAAER